MTRIFVCGMHRSGTSCVARVVNLLGAYFGDEEANLGANIENPAGFWERRDVRAINDRVLAASGADWNRVLRYSHAIASQQTQLQHDLQALLRELDSHGTWVVKEPRLCLTLPLWLTDQRPSVVVHVRRHPIEVARSLKKRNNYPLPVGLALWEFYVRTLARVVKSSKLPVVEVSYADLLAAPQVTTAKLYSDLVGQDAHDLSHDAIVVASESIDASLHRQRHQSKDDGYLFHSQFELWQQLELHGLHGGEIQTTHAAHSIDILRLFEQNLTFQRAKNRIVNRASQQPEASHASVFIDLYPTIARDLEMLKHLIQEASEGYDRELARLAAETNQRLDAIEAKIQQRDGSR